MHLGQADRVMKKLDGIWVLRTAQTKEEKSEWLDWLLGFDYFAMTEACDSLRSVLKWRPSMAELRDAYQAVLRNRDEAPPLLAGQTDPDAPTLRDLYGSEQRDWVYCWRCDMALSLEELSEGKVVFTERLGQAHRFCPKRGTAPEIPAYLRTEREDYWVKHHVRKPT